MQALGSALSIGRLAELSGLPVKTIRFYSDEGLLPDRRTEAGHRRYTEADLARLQLIRSLRDLGLDLPTVRQVLEGHDRLPDVLEAHALTLEARIRSLRRQLVVLRAAARSPGETNLRRVHVLARLDAAERRGLLEWYWERAVGESGPRTEASRRLREAAMPELGDDPTPEQLDAWLELTELATDEDYQQAVRDHLAWPWREPFDAEEFQRDHTQALDQASQAVAEGIEPEDPRADGPVAAFTGVWAHALGRQDGPDFRAWLARESEARSDPRIARYWELVGLVRGGGAECERPSPGRQAFDWLLRAMRHRASRPGG